MHPWWWTEPVSSGRGDPAGSPSEIAMTQNTDPIDRAARVVVAFAVALLSLSLGFGTVIGIVLLVVAGILLVTATVGFCPLYALFHISTRSRRHASL
jgi:uncharacterized membrane protein YphA (DoxX/SURF4 family)